MTRTNDVHTRRYAINKNDSQESIIYSMSNRQAIIEHRLLSQVVGCVVVLQGNVHLS